MSRSKFQRVKGDLIEDGVHIANTYQCVHCGAHWAVKVGSGTKRGFCMRCNGPTCGKEECDKCLPFENWLELQEKGETKVNIGHGVLRRITIKQNL